jgi:glucose-1-phosphate thymidylyltransferase
LIPVANKPVIEYAVENLRNAGITEIGIVLGNTGRDEIQGLLGDGSDYGVRFTYIVQGDPLGLAHAAGCAREFVGEDDFVMYLGDNILKRGISDIVDRFLGGEYSAGIALQEVDEPEQFGVAEVDEEGDVVRLVEKPDDPPTNLALIGIYAFTSEIFGVIEGLTPSWRGGLEITDALQQLLSDGRTFDSHIVDGWWKDTGKPADIIEANRLVLEDGDFSQDGTIEPGAIVEGRVDICQSSTVESGAVIRGPVSIAGNTRVKAETYIGPYTSIGQDTILENVHIENSVVIGDSTITTSGRIVDSLLGRGTEVGSAEELLPEGRRLVVGENSRLKL